MKESIIEEKFNFEKVLEGAINWSKEQNRNILEKGRELTELEIEMAKDVGVKNPENVRILEINEIPLPNNFELKKLGEEKGLFNSNLAGITFGYGIYVRKENAKDVGLISHELRHVYQFENEESLEIYLKKYINELLEYGYDNSPYEIDARENSIIK